MEEYHTVNQRTQDVVDEFHETEIRLDRRVEENGAESCDKSNGVGLWGFGGLRCGVLIDENEVKHSSETIDCQQLSVVVRRESGFTRGVHRTYA